MTHTSSPSVATSIGDRGKEHLDATDRRAFAGLLGDRRLERIAARSALKQAARAESGDATATALVSSRASGGVQVELTGGETLFASMSHRDGRGAAVADRRRRVGVDLERLDPIPLETARYFMTADERRRSSPDLATFWALKEAAWKALECGDSTPFTAIELHFDDYDEVRAVSLDGRRFAAGASVLSPWAGYVVAVVWLDGESA